jgi:hypothetical protein
VLVVAFFLLATAIRRWTVPPPAYYLVLPVGKPYEPRSEIQSRRRKDMTGVMSPWLLGSIPIATGYYTGEHLADSVGWPLALIGFGIFMITMSATAFRIDRDYVRRAR